MSGQKRNNTGREHTFHTQYYFMLHSSNSRPGLCTAQTPLGITTVNSVDYPDRDSFFHRPGLLVRIPAHTFPFLHTATTRPYCASPTSSFAWSHFATFGNSKLALFHILPCAQHPIPVGFVASTCGTGRYYLPFFRYPARGYKHANSHAKHLKCNLKTAKEAIRLQKKIVLCKSCMFFHLHLF